MSTLTKTLVAVVASLLVGSAAYVAAAPGDEGSPAPAADVKGPCDEPEHATDPRCAGPQVPEDNKPDDVGEHRRNADEAQPANDNEVADENEANDVNDEPGEVEDHANRGPGSLNSGPGNARDRGDDHAIDNSGPGSESSGPGESGSGDSGSGDSGRDSGSGGSGRD